MYKENDWERAREFFAKAARIDPSNPVIRIELAFALAEGGHREEALTEASNVQKNYARSANDYHSIGILFENAGRFEDARRAYEKAIELEPERVGVYKDLGDVLRKVGDNSAADRAYEAENRPKKPTATCAEKSRGEEKVLETVSR